MPAARAGPSTVPIRHAVTLEPSAADGGKNFLHPRPRWEPDVALQLLVRDRESLHRHGWAFVLWGAALLLFGIAILAWPGLTGAVLVALIGAMILAAGLVLMYGAWRLREFAERLWIAALVPALMVAVFGAVVLAFPDSVAAVLLVFVAVLVIIAGVGDLASAIALSPVVGWWWLRLLRGLLMVSAGVWAITSDLSGLVAIGWLLGAWALLIGAITIAFGVMALRA